MPAIQVNIYGGGGFAREVAWLVQSCNVPPDEYEVACFVDDNEAAHGKFLNGVPVMDVQTARSRFPHALMVGGVGSPRTRQHLMEKAAAVGFDFATIIHPRVERSEWIEIGAGTVICAGNILTTNIVLGRHVQINLDCTVGHDVIMGDYTTLAPGVHVSGCVHLGQRVYVGTGAVIINGTQGAPLLIGDDAIIGAGACVTKSIPPGLTVVGVPAKPLQRG
ncbi:MAG TPA: acetyltransferase [Chloroflexia bacterium]|nr:acetyltransferase [Chloroflexia bacterium]